MTSQQEGPTRSAPPPVGDRSLGELAGELTADLSRLMRQEIELAKAEAKQEAKQAAQGAGMFGGGGLAALVGLVFLSLAAVYGLGNVMDLEWAALIVGIVWAAIAAVLMTVGRNRLRQVEPGLPQTAETLKEDVRWARQRNS